MKACTAILIAVTLLLVLAPTSQACFDTYLFMQNGGMVYPYKMLCFDGSAEYVIGNYRNEEPDMFTGNMNIYYGLAKGFSVQAVFASSEKERTTFKIDDVGLRGVYSLVSGYRGLYNLDMILEHHQAEGSRGGVYEFSLPSIWHSNSLTYVVHPVAAFGHGMNLGVRGHGGIFHSTRNHATIGLGAEYESNQSSSNLGKRLVKGEGGTSLFFGTMLGQNVFLQNEIIKGWGPGSDKGDVGFAFTLKFLAPNGLKF